MESTVIVSPSAYSRLRKIRNSIIYDVSNFLCAADVDVEVDATSLLIVNYLILQDG